MSNLLMMNLFGAMWIDISDCLLSKGEDISSMFDDERTPVKSCGELAYHGSSYGKMILRPRSHKVLAASLLQFYSAFYCHFHDLCLFDYDLAKLIFFAPESYQLICICLSTSHVILDVCVTWINVAYRMNMHLHIICSVFDLVLCIFGSA